MRQRWSVAVLRMDSAKAIAPRNPETRFSYSLGMTFPGVFLWLTLSLSKGVCISVTESISRSDIKVTISVFLGVSQYQGQVSRSKDLEAYVKHSPANIIMCWKL